MLFVNVCFLALPGPTITLNLKNVPNDSRTPLSPDPWVKQTQVLSNRFLSRIVFDIVKAGLNSLLAQTLNADRLRIAHSPIILVSYPFACSR